jgi:uncharacterized protein YbjT (DUF2867 family)
MKPSSQNGCILVTGATGYVGGRLVPRLLKSGRRVRVMSRDPNRLADHSWFGEVEVMAGDALCPESLGPALAGVEAAYYLVHSLSGTANFYAQDLLAARNFGRAASQARISRIIYLGGLGHPQTKLSKHLRSRQETGVVLRESGIPVIEFRAAIIVGSGSASFEMIRYITEGLPVLFCPRWVHTNVQPISIHDVLEYLVAALDLVEAGEKPENKIIDIGGADVLTYRQMLTGYAQVRNLNRLVIPLPLVTSSFCATMLHWLTPIPAQVVRALIVGLRNEVVVREDTARTLFPQIKPRGYLTSVERALARVQTGTVETTWSDALGVHQNGFTSLTLRSEQGLLIERRQLLVPAPVHQVFQAFSGLGGQRGWLYADWAWLARGILDRLFGGVGFRRGRRHAQELRVGDAVDFWRVETVEPDHLLCLRAEMKLPGKAWLQFEAIPKSPMETFLVQTAFFAPKGLYGLFYWYALYPLHRFIFTGLIRKLAVLASMVLVTDGDD